MTDTVTITRYNATYDRIQCEPGIAQEISDHFTFDVPGAKHMPAFKTRVWDGKIRLFNLRTMLLYGGLRNRLRLLCEKRRYQVLISSDITERQYSAQETAELFDIIAPSFIEQRDYQMMAVMKAIRKRRLLLLSPTNSGKTFISYMLSRYHDDKKQLLVVPDTGLVHQTSKKFLSYGYPEDDLHLVYSMQEKQTDRRLTISTWQSIYDLPEKFFRQFQFIIGDEAHTFKANSLRAIMEKSVNADDRIAMTGSLDGAQVNELVIEGLFGPQYRTTTNRELIDRGISSEAHINVIMLTYDQDIRKLMKGAEYKDEVGFLIQSNKRNQFIVSLALDEALKGNTLITYRYVELHGKPLYDMIKQRVGSTRKVYLINKDVPGEERIEIADIVNRDKDAIIVASSRTFATGIDLPNLNNLILASPTKSQTQLLQSLGRMLRTSETKDFCNVYDIADDMTYTTTYGTEKPNHTLRHFRERLDIYHREKFTPRIRRIEI